MRYSFMIGFLLAFLPLIGCSNNRDVRGGSGFVEATEVLVSAETSGQVLERRVDEGNAVTTGDTLLVVDPSRLELELAAIRATRRAAAAGLESQRLQLKQAQRLAEFSAAEQKRIETLAKSSSASQQQLDKVVFDYDQAVLAVQTASTSIQTTEAELTRLDAGIALVARRLKDCYPISTLSGTVIETFVDPGELVDPGKPLCKLANLDTVWVKIYLPTASLTSVKLGDQATISTESGQTTHKGNIVWIADEAEFTPKNVQTEKSRADLVYAVKVSIPNPERELKIGMPVFVTL